MELPLKVIQGDQVRDADGKFVADCCLQGMVRRREEGSENAEAIVRAVNSHDEFISVCTDAIKCIEGMCGAFNVDPKSQGVLHALRDIVTKATK